ARFRQAVTLAAHLAFCREYWLHLMDGGEKAQGEFCETTANLPSLRPRFAAMEARWTAYLAGLDDTGLSREFELAFGEHRVSWYIEGQILQLLGHAPYHRGQVALLVDQMGGETVDTDYLFYARPLKM
ncbi:MAG: DinB family protein, partial [Akkermansiaceae bacterium]|nr:DinB family protein [Armatimonadota bacterium]